MNIKTIYKFFILLFFHTNTAFSLELNNYDVIIVGAGLGGLSAGAILAKSGKKVLILEQRSTTGGFASGYVEQGHHFFYGGEDISGVWDFGPLSYLVKQIGLKPQKIFVKTSSMVISDNEKFSVLPIDNSFQLTLENKFPQEKNNIKKFFSDAKKAYLQAYDPAINTPYGIPLDEVVLKKVYSKFKLILYPFTHRELFKWMNTTYQDLLNFYFSEQKIKNVLCCYLGYTGAKKHTSAFTVLVSNFGYFMFGGYYAKGGPQQFANILSDYIQNHNGKIMLKTKVDQILIDNNQVNGIKVKNQVFMSKNIISNVNAKNLYLKMIDPIHLETKFIEYIKKIPLGGSTIMIHLGVNLDLSDYPVGISSRKLHIMISSNADPELAPKGRSSLVIMTGADYKKINAETKNQITTELINHANQLIPNLKNNIIIQRVVTPQFLETEMGMPEGAIYCFDESSIISRPKIKTPIKGLYLVGASSAGGGVEAVVISGIYAAHDIIGWNKHALFPPKKGKML